MPRYKFSCPDCEKAAFMTVSKDFVPLCPFCKVALSRIFQPPSVIYIPERDRATNHKEGGKYREWLKSPAVQEKIRRGELLPERSSPIDPISDALDNA